MDKRSGPRNHKTKSELNQRQHEASSGYSIDWNAEWRRSKEYSFADKVSFGLPLTEVLGAAAVTLLAPPPIKTDSNSIDPGLLNSILYHSYGVTGMKQHEGAVFRLRSAPSAGAVYPIECYLACGDLGSLDSGLYHYLPEDFSLEHLVRGDLRNRIAGTLMPSVSRPSELYFLFSSQCGRTAQKFGGKAYRYCLLDCGHVIGNFLTVLESLGCATSILGAFCDEDITSLLDLRDDSENMMAVMSVGCNIDSKSPVESTKANTDLERIAIERSRYFPIAPELRRMHRAGYLTEDSLDNPRNAEAPEANRKLSPSSKPLTLNEDLIRKLESRDLGKVISERRSVRDFSDDPISLGELAAVLISAGIPYQADWLISPSNKGGLDYFNQNEIYVAVSNVGDLESGLYRYDCEGGALNPLFHGDVGEAVSTACNGQNFAGEAAAVIFLAPSFRYSFERQGNRGCRYAGIHAGILGERIYLTGAALELGVSGIADIDDAKANELCGVDGRDTAVLYALALGKPASS